MGILEAVHDWARRPGGARPDGASRLWRFFKVATCGSAFVGFALGWIALSYLVLPFLWVLPGTLRARRLRCQAVMRASWYVFHDYMRLVGLVHFNPRRIPPLSDLLAEHSIEGPVVVVANHPSIVDVTALVSGLGPMCYVVKSTLMHNPLFGPLLRMTGQISQPTTDSSHGVVEQAADRIANGHSVLLFPEGTRSPPGQLRRFRLGAFEIARTTGVPVVPVAIKVDPPSLYKGLPWYEITSRTIQLRMRVLSPLTIDHTSHGIQATRELMQRCRTAIEAELNGTIGR